MIRAKRVQVQGDHRTIEPYLKKGYNIINSANGNWVLARNAKVYVSIEGEDGSIYTYNMRMQILEFYGRVKISENLVNEFLRDFNENKILVYANGTYTALIEKAGKGER